MPRERFGPDHTFLPHLQLLDVDEISRLARLFVALGVRKIRLTGGEPLPRRDLPDLVTRLSTLRTPQSGEPVDIALTTNDSLLARLAPTLASAGLARVTASLDSLDDAVFRAMTDSRFGVADVLAGIDAAASAGLSPIKITLRCDAASTTGRTWLVCWT